MNKPLRRIAIFCGLLVLALLVRSNWLQFVQADELKNDPKNRRVDIARYAQPRGNIIVDGKAVTGSTVVNGTDFKYKRTYKNGELWSPVTGYASQRIGANQLEKLYDPFLTGDDDRLFFNRTIDMITGKQQKGGNVVTTLNAKAQKAAYDGLGDKKGAVAAINPKTGAILALANKPSYDPSTFAGVSGKDGERFKKLDDDKDQPMLNRALRQTYPPGSTFKVVTAAAGLESGQYDLDQKTSTEDPYRLPQTTRDLGNEGNNPACKNASVRVALQWSCNTVFAKMSDELGNDEMIKMAEKFGFEKDVKGGTLDPDLDTPVRPAKSIYPEDNRPQNAMAGIGQASNRATPLQMAMVAAAVANDGKLMKPYMVDQLVAPNLNVVEQTKPKELSRPVSAENAQKLQSAMETVVEKGTGTAGKIPGVTVGGKTGTAQHGENNKDNPYAWFISYAKTSDGSPVAVAVVVESSDTLRDDIAGGKLAAPIAKSVMEAVLDGKQ
ncbi:peptidoglycan D,D-transpeptidase FtsI family protein [Streptomyces smyrnaeus]|uniref:peptidoglycan D,D-transpeptidase FtsI family protein n=1 Tax=Streptomyces TaxID=1883 RepID=UPI000C19F075|nr:MULTISPECIES: penicillin-binding protein 2 [unclassified Streptomyces]MBQ0864448.1 penicillin-binding protein 2 [Streptomyces sp. RK75]MBQ1118789.1 penicillin-binding protein 2 [Streptomyces sp. B15]MBQ1157010.1 penicillin-binding protein 2 [Streptomyces sp. A73]